MTPSSETYQPQNNNESDIIDLILVFWRSKFFILLFLIIGIIGGYFLSASLKPVYSASGKVLIQKSEDDLSIDNIQAVKRILNLDTAYILTQIEVLKSPALISKVVKKLNLQNDPEFSKNENKNTVSITAPRNFDDSGFMALPAEVSNPELSSAIVNLTENLNVAPIRGSYVVRLGFNSESPIKAALIANTLIDFYVQEKSDDSFTKKERVMGWLDNRLRELNDNKVAAERELEIFKLNSGLSDMMINGTSASEMLSLNRELSEAKRALSEVKILNREAANLKKSGDSANFQVSGTSSVVKEIKLSQAKAENNFKELSKRYGPLHPEIIAAQSEIEGLKVQLNKEVKKLENNLTSTVKQAEARVQALEKSLDEAHKERENNNDAIMQLKILEQKVDAARDLYDTFFDSYKRLVEKGSIETTNARVLSYANIPEEPLFPNPTLIIGLCAIISTFLGVMIAFLLPGIRRKSTN